MSTRPTGSRGVAAAVALVFAAMIALFPIGIWASNYGNPQTRTCTVVDKDRTRTDNGSDMRVYTVECGTVQVADRWLRGNFSAADTFAGLRDGGVYEIDTVGWRVPLLSMFPTVLDVREVPAP